MKRKAIGFVASTLLPPLGAVQYVVQTQQLASAEAWSLVLAIGLASFTAAAIGFLTQLNADVGNPPVPPPTLPTTVSDGPTG